MPKGLVFDSGPATHMNRPPLTCIRVPHRQLHQFVLNCAQNVGMPAGKAELLAQLLTTNDLRGVFLKLDRRLVMLEGVNQRGAKRQQDQAEPA